MTRHSIRVTDHGVAEQIGDGILVGKAFAFVPADVLDRPALAWVRTLIGTAAVRPRVVPLLGGDTPLPGLTIGAVDRPPLATGVITSDKALYREGADVVNLLVCDPLGGERETELTVELSGQSFGRRPVRLSSRGVATLALRDLPAGDYKVRLRGAGAGDPPCAFTVAEYRLSPLVAQLDNQRAEGDKLALEVTLTSFGVPASGAVGVELFDGAKRIDRQEVTARDGAARVGLTLRGDGPHTVNFQLVADAGRTATIPLVGSRAAERSETTFSTLGAEVVGTVLASEDAREVRGLYLRRGGTSTSPVRLDRVDTRRPTLTAMTDLELTVAIIDPTLVRSASAVDPSTVPHPAHVDERYRHGEELFLRGDHAGALETFVGARAQLEQRHPNYAYYIACCHARMGQTQQALAALRLAIREGWRELAHLRADDDLASLRGEPEFAAIASNGVRIVEATRKRGETLALDVPAPLAYLAMGAFADGTPWEGHAAIVAPPAADLALEVSEATEPGRSVAITLRSKRADAAAYVIVKDARLLSPDTPTSRLAGQLKSHVEAMRDQVLGSGVPATRLSSLIPRPAPPPMPHYHEGGGGARGMMPPPMGMPPSVSMPVSASRPGSPPITEMRARMGLASPAPGPVPQAPMKSMMMMDTGAAPPPKGGAPYRSAPEAPPAKKVAVEDTPEVVYAGLVTLRNGTATLDVVLGEAFTDYLVEAFLVDGVEWTAATARFRAERAVFASFDAPAFVHRGDTALGRIVVGGSGRGATIEVTCDGAPIAVTADGEPLATGAPVMGKRVELAFVCGPGDYAVRVVDVAGEVAEARMRIDEPGKLRRLARAVRLLRPGERVGVQDDPSIIALRPLPGLDKPFSLLCDATADYGHACCEQTAAKIIAACGMYAFAGDDKRRRDRAEEIILAGVRRERSMHLPGRGFKMYPDSGNTPHDYYGKATARYLWNLELLRPSASTALLAAIDDALAMARDATAAYKLEYPPRTASTPTEAYYVVRFGDDARARDRALALVKTFAAAPSPSGGAVAFRADAAYAAAALFRAGGDAGLPAALALANRVVSELGPEGRLYSTVDSVAAIALMMELQAAGVVGHNGRAITRPEATEVVAEGGVVAVEVSRMVEEDWDRFTAKLPVTVTTLAKDRPTARVAIGDAVDLHVRIDGGYQAGDLVWVALPDALSRVVGGGQVKRFSVDLAGKSEITIPLAATAVTIDRTGDEAPQHFAVCVRNMFEEERAGNPGPLDITVVPPRGGDGLFTRAVSALRRLLS